MAKGSPELSAIATRREAVSKLTASMMAAKYRIDVARCGFTGRLGYPIKKLTNTFLELHPCSFAI